VTAEVVPAMGTRAKPPVTAEVAVAAQSVPLGVGGSKYSL
jgi:hypothetical protein